MDAYYLVVGDQRQPMRLGERLHGGGEAEIRPVPDFQRCVAKIYHRDRAQHASRDKLEAMLLRPPEHMTARANGVELPQFAWPTHVIEDSEGAFRGFLMREVPKETSELLSSYMSRVQMRSRLSDDDCSLPRRVLVCANLASAMTELHRLDHYFVDMKPANIAMFKDTGILCLLDNDSFSIAGSPDRFPATAFTSEYLAPELMLNALAAGAVITDWQDRFALAVVVFQILNNGLHPFQGVPQFETDEWNIDMCVRRDLYPYGLVPHALVRPPQGSVHETWPVALRQMFDRAFTEKQASKRPSAKEWRNLLQSFQGQFVRCAECPDDVLHIHFAEMGCQECLFEKAARKRSAEATAQRPARAIVLETVSAPSGAVARDPRPNARAGATPVQRVPEPSASQPPSMPRESSSPALAATAPAALASGAAGATEATVASGAGIAGGTSIASAATMAGGATMARGATVDSAPTLARAGRASGASRAGSPRRVMTALAVLLAAIGGGVFLAHESRTGSPSTAPTDGPSVTAAPSPSPAETPPAVAQVRPAPSLAPAAPALRSPSPTVGAGAAPPVSRPSPGDASGRKATEAPPPAAPMSLAPTTLALAKAVTSEDDANGIAARLQVVRQAVSVAYGLNAGEMMTIIEAGIAGDDARTLASARTLMRNTEFTSGYADWNYTRASGRKLNDSALQTYKSDLRSATSTQLSAVALAPVDREIAANLAYYLALGRQPGVMGAASYSLSLPRPPDATGTASAWQMVGVAFARAGKLRESEGAFDVGLAITTKLPAFCLNLLTHEREMGPELRPPIEAVFKRIADRGQSDAANCAYPPQWLR